MFGMNTINDVRRAVPAIVTNQLAKFAPDLYIRLTRETGRGPDSDTAHGLARYFQECFADYFRVLGVSPEEVPAYLRGKRVLEYGPGDIPGVALLMLANGAEQAFCADRFPLVTLSEKNVDVLRCLIEELPEHARRRAQDCFRAPGNPGSGFREERLQYIVKPSGLAGLSNTVDLVISRAVLEHVNDLSATFADMHAALRADGVAVHQVDLKSHGLHRVNRLEFLTWPAWLWSMMYGGKGAPNRWRIDRYRKELSGAGLYAVAMQPIAFAQQS
jgi:hypothetical protein